MAITADPLFIMTLNTERTLPNKKDCFKEFADKAEESIS